jgi:hypothetical protein
MAVCRWVRTNFHTFQTLAFDVSDWLVSQSSGVKGPWTRGWVAEERTLALLELEPRTPLLEELQLTRMKSQDKLSTVAQLLFVRLHLFELYTPNIWKDSAVNHRRG